MSALVRLALALALSLCFAPNPTTQPGTCLFLVHIPTGLTSFFISLHNHFEVFLFSTHHLQIPADANNNNGNNTHNLHSIAVTKLNAKPYSSIYLLA